MAYFQSKEELQFQFRQRLIELLNHFRLYEDKRNQELALACIPIDNLTQVSQAKYDSCSSGSADEFPNEYHVSRVRDILLLELMAWFKNRFFVWMDKPSCPKCSKETQLVENGIPTLDERCKSASRVEIYTCPQCFPGDTKVEVARFPRYNNPVTLLETRIGRCGEWANCFALICRAMNFEVRHVTDWLDHVWVEVFSMSQNRWLHCDPCENKVDCPVMYDIGWGKKLTYVIAVSHDDIQDVTWRYCHNKNHKAALARRNLVDEKWLLRTILELRKECQNFLTDERKRILNSRLVTELVEFMTPTKDDIKLDEKAGRESGSVAWRLARNEIGEVGKFTGGFEWKITKEMVRRYEGKLKYYYDCAQDAYFYGDSNNTVERGWENGSFEAENVFRKVEKDWNMAYLARQERDIPGNGKLSWKFVLPDYPHFTIEDVHIYFKSTTFHSSASTRVEVSSEHGSQRAPASAYTNGAWIWKCPVNKTRWVKVTCFLEGGHGNLAWQHAQLFRQSTKIEQREPSVRPFRIVLNIYETKL